MSKIEFTKIEFSFKVSTKVEGEYSVRERVKNTFEMQVPEGICPKAFLRKEFCKVSEIALQDLDLGPESSIESQIKAVYRLLREINMSKIEFTKIEFSFKVSTKAEGEYSMRERVKNTFEMQVPEGECPKAFLRKEFFKVSDIAMQDLDLGPDTSIESQIKAVQES